MAYKSYYEKLKDPRWQKRRLEALSAADWRCELCYDNESTLHVHHKAYIKGKEPWDYDADQLAVLCEACHEGTHDFDLFLEATSRLPVDGPNSRHLLGYFLQGTLRRDNLVFEHNSDAAAYLLGFRFHILHSEFLKAAQTPGTREAKALAILMDSGAVDG
jgi:hypothetical protein